MTKETKYFMAGTDEEVLLGDVIEVVLIKDFKDGRKIKRNMELKLTEATIPYALDLGVIEEGVPDEENEDLLGFDEDNDIECPYDESISDIIEDQEVLEMRIDDLEKKVDEFIKESKDFMKSTLKELNEKDGKEKPSTKTASSKKK